MPKYDAAQFDPPAPVASVALRRDDGAVVSDVLLRTDTGADTTLLPRADVRRLGLTPDPNLSFELIGFDGHRTATQAVDMLFLGKAFRGRYLLTDADRGILGRDVLASVAVVLDGPNEQWFQLKPT